MDGCEILGTIQRALSEPMGLSEPNLFANSMVACGWLRNPGMCKYQEIMVSLAFQSGAPFWKRVLLPSAMIVNTAYVKCPMHLRTKRLVQTCCGWTKLDRTALKPRKSRGLLAFAGEPHHYGWTKLDRTALKPRETMVRWHLRGNRIIPGF